MGSIVGVIKNSRDHSEGNFIKKNTIGGNHLKKTSGREKGYERGKEVSRSRGYRGGKIGLDTRHQKGMTQRRLKSRGLQGLEDGVLGNSKDQRGKNLFYMIWPEHDKKGKGIRNLETSGDITKMFKRRGEKGSKSAPAWWPEGAGIHKCEDGSKDFYRKQQKGPFKRETRWPPKRVYKSDPRGEKPVGLNATAKKREIGIEHGKTQKKKKSSRGKKFCRHARNSK